MDTSRRAVESYWRSKMIDVATSDEDKVTPVYKLEEICELLRSSHVSIVKEVSEFIFRRLQHKSPIVKQKALRVIKYAVGKSGAEFKREMQRNSVAIRGLIHHKGQPDPLKGDALNKSIRETAQEALSAIFSEEDNSKPPPTEGLTRRIEGFGNTTFDKSSNGNNKSFLSEVVGIGTGSSTIKQGLNSLTQNRSPNPRRSLTNETSYSGSNESLSSSSFSTSPELKTNSCEKSREERLVDTIVTPGGVRLQPTRDALQVFLTEASKLNALALSHALEAKLQSHMWQVCVKALCVLEAILRKKDDEHFLMVTSYFTERIEVVVRCSESPQASVRERANKVLTILNGDLKADRNFKTKKPVIQIPDLIDTNDQNENENENEKSIKVSSLATPTTSLIDDFFGGDGDKNQPENNDDHDPFADVSFHAQNNKDEHESSDIFGVQGEDHKDHVKDLMAVLSLDGNKSPDSTINGNPQMNDDLGNVVWSQAHGINPNHMFSMDPMAFAHQPINYAAMSNFLGHQQFLSTMCSNISHVSNNASGTQIMGSTSALPDIFNPVIASQAPTSTMNASKKDETRAFDFISDHLGVGRDPKRVS